ALNTGVTAVIARLFGSGRIGEAKQAAKQTLVIVVALGMVVSVIMYLAATPILLFMGAQEDTMAYGVRYFELLSLSFTFSVLMMSINSMVRGSGDTRTPMVNNIIGNIVNVICNVFLINGLWFFPALGVTGAGLSRIISRSLGAILALSVVSHHDHPISISWREKFSFDFGLLKNVVTIGIPAALEQFVMRFGQIQFVRIVSGLGTDIYAAHQVALSIFSLSFSPGMGFGMAATTLVGQSLGARRPDWAEQSTRVTRKTGTWVAGFMGVIFFLFGAQIAWLYAPNDPLVVENAAVALKIIAFVQIMQSTQFIYVGALRGAGDTSWPLYATFIGVWGVRVVFAHLLVVVFDFGLIGAWLAMSADQCVRWLIVTYRFNSGKWKTARTSLS
ncbi:MAG: MATE family efflux transporter, partial [Symbiobacteriaceae bacterium]|nr:MATE family efflux transporter [Symbiobacteriaceae bacterium]